MKRSDELKQKRSAIAGKVKALYDEANKPGEARNYTKAEQKEVEKLLGKQRELNEQIDIHEKLEENMRNNASKNGKKVSGIEKRSLGDHVEEMIREGQESRALNIGTPADGGFASGTYLHEDFIESVTPMSATLSAGMRTINLQEKVGKNSFTRVETAPEASFYSELATISDSSMTFSSLDFNLRAVIVQVPVSKQLMEGSMNIGNILDVELRKAIAQEIDRVSMYGTGTGEPLGLANLANIQKLDLASVMPTNFDYLIDSSKLLFDENFNKPQFSITSPGFWALQSKFKNSQGDYLSMPSSLNDHTLLQTSKIPVATNITEAFTGNFENLVLGIQKNLEIEVFRSNQTKDYSHIVQASMLCDLGVERDKSFVHVENISLV